MAKNVVINVKTSPSTVEEIYPITKLENIVGATNLAFGQGYGTCSTAAATVAKVGTLANYELVTGGIVSIKFTNAVPASATLNINSKGAKNIFYKGSAITANVIKAGDTATFIYDGTRYQLISIDTYDDKFLKLDGGGFLRNTTNDDQAKIGRATNDSQLYILGGNHTNNGAFLMVNGKEMTTDTGCFLLRANDGTNTGSLKGFPNGSVTWEGKHLVRSVNSKNADSSGNITVGASDVDALPVNDPMANSGLRVKSQSTTKGTNPSSYTFNGIWIMDSSGSHNQSDRLGGFETQVSPNGEVITRFQGYGIESGSTEATSIQLGVRADGSKWTSVTPPPDDSWGDAIATTGWVRKNIKGGSLDIDYLADEQLLVFEKQTQSTSVHAESVGFITISLSNTIPSGYLPLLGYTYSRSAYADLYDYAVTNGLIISDSDWLVLEETQNGNVPFYSSGDGSTTFRVPKLNGWVKAGEQAGNYLEAGLPNITGQFGGPEGMNNYFDGAFYLKQEDCTYNISNSGDSDDLFGFDASLSSPIYGKSNTVQPESVSVIYVVKAFGELTNIGSTDIATLSDQITYITNNYIPKNDGTASNLRVDGLTLEGRKVMREPQRVRIYSGGATNTSLSLSQSWKNFDALCFVVKSEGTSQATMCTTVIKQNYEIQILLDSGATNIGIDFQPRGDSDRSYCSYHLPGKNGSTDTSWALAFRKFTYVAEVWGLTY